MKGFRRSTGGGRGIKKKSQFQAVVSDEYGPSHFEAEVISVQRGKHGAYFLWLLRTSDGVRINALLSSHLSLPKEGDMVLVRGDFEKNQKAKALSKPVRLRIASITHLGRQSAQHAEWSEALQRALVGHVPVKESRTIRRPVIVTGQDTDVEHDIRRVLEGAEYLDAGFPMFVFVDLGSPESIAAGLRQAAHVPDVRAIVLARGGTSEKWQLHPFSHPEVVRAVAGVTKSIPVVVAVGHAKDHPLCEQVASFVVPAPSAVGKLFHELNQARQAQFRREVVAKEHLRRGQETPAREANALVQAPSAPAAVVAGTPQIEPPRRHRWIVGIAVTVMVLAAGGATWRWGNFKTPVAEPLPPQSQPNVATPVRIVPPAKPAQPARRRQKPARKPVEKAAVATEAVSDAGTEVPSAAVETPQVQSQIQVFE